MRLPSCRGSKKRLLCVTRIATVLGSISLSLHAFAQAVDSGALQRQQQQNVPLERPGAKPPRDAPKLQVQQPVPEKPQAPAVGKLFVKRFKLAAVSTLLNEAELNSLLSDFLGHENSVEDLQKASERVSSRLRERGYAFARAVVPRQEVVDGTVTIEIAQGRLATEPDGRPSISVKTEGKTRLDEQRARATVTAALSDPGGLNISEIERGLLLLNDMPGVRGSGVVVPGREPGTLGLALEVREGPLVGGWIGVDNFGSRSTGTNRLTANAGLNNPSGRGDLAELNLAKSSGIESATASYLLPIGVSGLRVRLAASGMRYEVQDELAPPDTKGSSNWLSAGLSYPMLRTQAANLYLTGTVDARQFKDSVAGVQATSRRTRTASVGAQGNQLSTGAGRFLSYSATASVGDLDRGAVPADLAADAATRRTQGSYGILRATGSWLEQLGARFSASATLAMQFSSKNLDSSEKIYLGGPRGVRAYPIEEAGSDAGQILNLEARWRMPQPGESGGHDWTLFGFFDAGRAMLNRNTWTGWNVGNPGLRNEYVLRGWGAGIRGQIARAAQIEIVGARKIGSNPGASATGLDANGRSGKNRLWLVGTIFF
jgi:hemolysin activation/secretion protein